MPPPRKKAKPLFVSDRELAVARLQRRLQDLQQLDQVTTANDIRVSEVERRVVADVREIFGDDSREFDTHREFRVWQFTNNASGGLGFMLTHGQHIRDAKRKIQILIELIEERITDEQLRKQRPSAELAVRGIHRRILAACGAQFRDRHYRSAVLDATIALVEYVKERAGNPSSADGRELDGARLMTAVFSVEHPRLAFNELRDQSERDEQLGLMRMFEGAVIALRNPRAHALSVDTPENAADAISTLSFLAKQLDRARSVSLVVSAPPVAPTSTATGGT